jgi:hypothetical protein
MKIVIVSPVSHDGKDLEIGKTVNLDDDAAKALIKAGAAETFGKFKAEPQGEALAAEPTAES